jgi:hypothetical protein
MGLFDTTKTETQTTNQTATQNPWATQVPYLQQAFGGASNALNQAQGAQAPNGFVAQFTPQQLQAFGQMLNYGTAPGTSGAATAAGNQLLGAGANATAGGLYGLAGYNPGAASNAILGDAQKFSNDPNISGMVDASMRDARRMVSEQALPQVARNAAATGNINSSRRAIREGIIERGLADQTADTSAALRQNAWNQGIGVGQQGQNNALQALMARVTGGNQAVGAGVGAGTGAVNQQGGLFDIANRGIAGQQGAAQAGLDDQMKSWEFGTNAPFAGLNNFYNIVGNKSWGGTTNTQGTTTGTGTTTPSTMAQIGAGLGMVGSLF